MIVLVGTKVGVSVGGNQITVSVGEGVGGIVAVWKTNVGVD